MYFYLCGLKNISVINIVKLLHLLLTWKWWGQASSSGYLAASIVADVAVLGSGEFYSLLCAASPPTFGADVAVGGGLLLVCGGMA